MSPMVSVGKQQGILTGVGYLSEEFVFFLPSEALRSF